MRVLVTGAGGFLGRHLLPLLGARHEVIALCRRRPDRAVAGPVDWIEADLAAPLDERALPSAVDGVIHLAQSRRYREFPEGSPDMFRVNVAATAALLHYAARAGGQHFILASTGSVYGAQPGPVSEDAPAAADGYYPVSKLAAETLLRPYAGEMAVCAARLFTLYGRGQTGSLVANLVDRVRTGDPITLAGGGDGPSFNPTHASDAAAAVVRGLEEGWSGVLNLAAHETVTIRELGLAIGAILGIPPRFEATPGPAVISPVPDLSRLSGLYDRGAFRSLRDGLRSAVQP